MKYKNVLPCSGLLVILLSAWKIDTHKMLPSHPSIGMNVAFYSQYTIINWQWYNYLYFCSWWRHQMETFSALLALCAGNSPVPVNSPHKGQWRGALVFSLICARINDWVNNREAGDLRRHRGHYDVSVMLNQQMTAHNWLPIPLTEACWWLPAHIMYIWKIDTKKGCNRGIHQPFRLWFILTTYSATSDNKVAITMTTVYFTVCVNALLGTAFLADGLVLNDPSNNDQ